MLLPLFADLQYNFCNSVVSPFVGIRAGGYAHVNSEEVEGVRVFVNPAVGLEIKRFSIRIGYEYQHNAWGFEQGNNKHRLRCGVEKRNEKNHSSFFIYFTKACLYPFCKFQYPLVKSGTSTGILPFSIDRRESSIIEHHSARS